MSNGCVGNSIFGNVGLEGRINPGCIGKDDVDKFGGGIRKALSEFSLTIGAFIGPLLEGVPTLRDMALVVFGGGLVGVASVSCAKGNAAEVELQEVFVDSDNDVIGIEVADGGLEGNSKT